MPLDLELVANKLQHSTPKFSIEEYWVNNNNNIYLYIIIYLSIYLSMYSYLSIYIFISIYLRHARLRTRLSTSCSTSSTSPWRTSRGRRRGPVVPPVPPPPLPGKMAAAPLSKAVVPLSFHSFMPTATSSLSQMWTLGRKSGKKMGGGRLTEL